MERKKIIQILNDRMHAAKYMIKTAKYYQTQKRNEGRVYAYKLAINLLKTNGR
jgi:hypothetical protein